MIDLQYLNTASFFVLNHAASALPDGLWASLTITGHTSMVFALLAPLLLPRWRDVARADGSVGSGSIVITALFLCALIGGLAATVLKESFQLPRPPAVLSADSFHLIGHKLELVSFPSGHTLTAFAVATLLILGFALKGWRLYGLIALASLVGLSRVAVGAHWPLDVLAGAVVGVFCAYLSLITAKYLHHRLQPLSSWFYVFFQITLLLAVSISLFWTGMGYPEAMVWQYVVAAFGVIICLCAIYSHLLTLKGKL
jgi:membrane-associated phospholipid phosphatase